MLMTTPRLILLRLFNVTFGRSAFLTGLLRRALVAVLIERQAKGLRYMASSRFFQMSDLD